MPSYGGAGSWVSILYLPSLIGQHVLLGARSSSMSSLPSMAKRKHLAGEVQGLVLGTTHTTITRNASSLTPQQDRAPCDVCPVHYWVHGSVSLPSTELCPLHTHNSSLQTTLSGCRYSRLHFTDGETEAWRLHHFLKVFQPVCEQNK